MKYRSKTICINKQSKYFFCSNMHKNKNKFRVINNTVQVKTRMKFTNVTACILNLFSNCAILLQLY